MVMVVFVPVRQRFQHVIRPCGIAERDHPAVAFRRQRIARPVAHPAARTLHHRHQRGNVVQLQASFHHDVDMAGRQQRIVIAVPAPDRVAALAGQAAVR